MNNIEIITEEIKLMGKEGSLFKKLGEEIYPKWKEGTLSIYLDEIMKDFDKKIKEIELNLGGGRGDAEKRRSDEFDRESINQT